MLLGSMRCAKARYYAVVALIVLAMPLTTVAQGTGVDASEQPLASEDAAPSDDVEVDAGEQPLASEDSAPADDVEVIRVLGQSGSGSGIDTDAPTSATQFDAETLQMLGVGDISDLTLVTPNLEIRTAGSTSPTFFIRGVGLSDFSSIASGAVAIYQDGIALNAPALQLGQLFDLENVEVLRGPQGSGPGRNASAGAIKVNSRKPTGNLLRQLQCCRPGGRRGGAHLGGHSVRAPGISIQSAGWLGEEPLRRPAAAAGTHGRLRTREPGHYLG